MIQSIIDILSAIKEIFTSMVDTLGEFVNTLTEVENNISDLVNLKGGMVYTFIGHFRYLVGDVIYLGFYAIIVIGANMLLFNLARIVIKSFDSGVIAKIPFKFK